ncbi:MAG: hypothetical protein KF785_00720 [Gemmatimonadales bacterium]|nr:hypothetical protein [Gemmatimonadales bacterium]
MIRISCLTAALGIVGIASGASAQQASGVARARGMADAFGAVARGAEAAMYNPANLGLRTQRRFSMTLPAGHAAYGSAPVTFADINRFAGEVLPDEVKAAWLSAIPEGGVFRGRVDADLTGIGIAIDRLAVTVGAVGHASIVLPRMAAELLLNGNAGIDGSFGGGSGRYFAASYLALSGGLPVAELEGGVLAAGATVKYLHGHAYGSIWNVAGSIARTDATTDLRFPAVTVGGGNHGVGLDLGVAWEGSRLSLSASVMDLRNTLGWSTRDARLRDGRALVAVDTVLVEFDDRPLDDPSLPAPLVHEARARLDQATVRPALRLAGAYRIPGLVLAADLVHRSSDESALLRARGTELGLGGEYRPFALLRLRAGAGLGQGGGQWTVGSGLLFGGVAIDAAYGRRRTDGTTLSLASLGLSIGLR